MPTIPGLGALARCALIDFANNKILDAPNAAINYFEHAANGAFAYPFSLSARRDRLHFRK